MESNCHMRNCYMGRMERSNCSQCSAYGTALCSRETLAQGKMGSVVCASMLAKKIKIVLKLLVG